MYGSGLRFRVVQERPKTVLVAKDIDNLAGSDRERTSSRSTRDRLVDYIRDSKGSVL